MGTSSSHSGPVDGPGLLPEWAVSGDEAPVDEGVNGVIGHPAINGEGDGESGGTEQPSESVEPTTQQPWKAAKSRMTRYVNTGGGRDRLRSSGSGYVNAKGGAGRAARLASSGKNISRNIGSFLSSAVRTGLPQAFNSIGLKDVVGQPFDQVIERIVDALSPVGATREAAAARNAVIEVVEFLYETVIGIGNDFSVLEEMDTETIEQAIALSVSGYIYNRWLDELGLSIENGKVSESEAVLLEQEVKDYVESCVILELEGRSAIDINWSGEEGRIITDAVYRDAYDILEAGS